MRARLSAISNFTTSQLLIILQNWTRDTSEIIVDGQVLRVISVYFLSNDNRTSNNESNMKSKVTLFSAIGSASGLLLFLCVCCIIISFCTFMKFKSKRNNNVKPRFVVHIISNKNNIITMYTEYTKIKKEKIIIVIITIWQQEEDFIMSYTMCVIMITMVFLQIGNERFFDTKYVLICMILAL